LQSAAQRARARRRQRQQGDRAGRRGHEARGRPDGAHLTRLERIVADDLWPLPKDSEMLFIK
jgi:glutamine synthetase type III